MKAGSMLSVLAVVLESLLPFAATQTCKATPDSSSWPSDADWDALNKTLSGRLLKPPPPAAICHPDESTYNPAQCKATQWTNATTYADNPIGIMVPNWSNDSCLPPPKYPCSAEGFPVFVVNASCAEHVAAGIDFARTHNVRLNVKSSGHDYLGRSTAPNSLSIWTKHIRGIDFHESFKPQGCSSCSPHPAVTLGAGEDWGSIYTAAAEYNLTLVGGTGDTIGLGGYLTGGGHSPLSAKFGLAVDQILEIGVELACGENVIANQVQNVDLFWALRGGGGATFGVITSVTLKTFPDMPVAVLNIVITAEPDSEAFWNFSTYILSQAPRLQDSGIMGYSYLSPAYPYNGTIVGGFLGQLLMPNGTVAEAEGSGGFLADYVNTIPGADLSFTPVQYDSVFAWYQANKNVAPVGINEAIGNRLLDAKALSNLTALREAMTISTTSGGLANVNLVAGPGLWKAKPAGGSDSVNPAWRKAYLEYVVPVFWPPLNGSAKEIQTHLLTDVYIEALRQLAPDTGSYLNEGDVNEPNFQEAFWGANYPRLFSIKRQVDPLDLFWCATCVGNEMWEERGNRLCRI